MSDTQVPAPPELPGITYESFLGSGGFADVYLYRQQLPSRLIAVKVIRPGADPAITARFQDETDIMALVSTHPCVVSVHGAGQSADGRRFLVMEYCRPPHLGRLARASQLGLDRVLRDMVLVCGAVETIHRAGFLHRDIKPSNILVNSVGRPALADFGLAVPIEAQVPDDDFGGASPPWASYEQQVGHDALTPASDVYALGATLYTLLTGRSPHEDPSPGASNTHRDMLYRAQFGIFPPVTRHDVPESLRRVLRVALAARPEDRYPTALAFARGLQEVQRELELPITEVEVMEQAPAAAVEDADDRTVLRPVAAIDPYADHGDAQVPDATRFRPRVVIPLPATDAAVDAPTVVRSRAVPNQAAPSYGGSVVDTASGHLGPSLTAGARPYVLTGAPPAPEAAGAGPVAPDGVVPVVAGGAGAVQEAAPARRGRTWAVAAAVAVLVVGIGAVGAWSVLRGEGGTSARHTASAAPDVVADEDSLVSTPPVRELTLTPNGDAVDVTWAYDRPDEEDVSFLYRVIDPAGEQDVEETTDLHVQVAALPGRTCVEVVVRSARGSTSQPATECVETP